MMTNTLLSAFLFLTIFTNAQSVYTFQTENLPYQNLTGSTSLNNGAVWDDPGYTIPLGFTFTIGDYTFDTIYILDWSVGGILASDPFEGGIVPLFVPIGQDVIDLGFTAGISESNISYKTEGASGARILKLEWNNVGFFSDSTESDFMNFQLWLYEGSNIVEYRYGVSSINNPTESFEGESGPQINLATAYNIDLEQLEDNGYFLSGNPTTPTLHVLTPADPLVLTFLQGMMPNGTVYRFIPDPLSITNNEKIKFIVYPNPVANFITLQVESENYNVTIYDALGKKVNTIEPLNNSIDVSALHSGMYFLSVDTTFGISTKKFIKL